MASAAHADVIQRDGTSPNASMDLNLGAGWIDGVAPGSDDIAAFWSTPGSPSDPMPTPPPVLGADLHWLGMTVDINDFASGTVIGADAVPHTHALTLGASGLTVTGNRSLFFDNDFVLGADQQWSNPNMTGNKAIRVNGRVDLGGFSLDLVGKGGKTFNGAISGTGDLFAATQIAVELNGVNTYTGDTTVAQGLLVLSDDAQLKFIIGTNGVNNRITSNDSGDNGILQLNGDFNFDLSAAGTTLGDQWAIVDIGSDLVTTFGDTFSVLDFTDVGDGAWSRDANGVTYRFTESNGLLAVVPEPGTLALAGVGLSLIGRRPHSRRRCDRSDAKS